MQPVNPHEAYALGYHPTTAPNLRPASTRNGLRLARINFMSRGCIGLSLKEYYRNPAVLDNRGDIVHRLLGKTIYTLEYISVKFSVRLCFR